MAATRLCVHRGFPCFTHRHAFDHECVNLSDIFNCDNVEVFNINDFLFILFQIKFLFCVSTQQVSDVFVVNFEVAAPDQELFILVFAVIYVAVNVLECGWDDPFEVPVANAHHGV